MVVVVEVRLTKAGSGAWPGQSPLQSETCQDIFIVAACKGWLLWYAWVKMA